jgi:hypothetical protein
MSCSTNYVDLGKPGCPSKMAVAKRLVYVPEFAADGTRNKISLADAKTLSNWVAKFDATNTKDRFYPIVELDNITNERAEPEFETLDSGRLIETRKGVRNFIGHAIQQGPIYLSQLESWENVKFGVYIIDKDDNIIYKKCEGDTDLYPITVDEGSYYNRFMTPTYSTSEKIEINFNFRQLEKDSELRVLPKSELDSGFSPLADFFALLDVTGVASSISTTGFTMTLTDPYGDAVEDLVSGDFALAEVSPTPGSVTISSVTESSAGVYDFTFSAETSGDVLALTPTKSGYDFSAIPSVAITIP